MVSITTIRGGIKKNVIAEHVEPSGTIRSTGGEARQRLLDELERALDVGRALGAECELHIFEGYPVTMNDAAVTETIRASAKQLLGTERVIEMPFDPWAEDFGYLTAQVPGAMFWLGVTSEKNPIITSEISDKRNPLALYIPYSDFIVERWSNYFLPALDAFRALGVTVDILPYAPRLDESVYPYYPIHHNEEVLERLLKERTVLVLANVSGFQQTDSDLIKEFVAGGGVIVAFGEQIPMGRSYERREIFGVDEASAASSHSGVIIKDSVGSRVKSGTQFALSGLRLPSWTPAGSARVIAAFEDRSPAVTVNKYGKGTVVTILADAPTAAQNMPDLVHDVLDYALSASGNSLSVDIVGTNEATDVAVKKTSDGFRLVIINHNASEREVIVRPVKSGFGKEFEWVDLVSGQRMVKTGADFSLKLKITGGGFRSLEFRRTSTY